MAVPGRWQVVGCRSVEGFKRRGRSDKVHFYNIAQGSLEELRYYFILCRELGCELDYASMAAQADQVSRMLTGLIKAVRVGSSKAFAD